MVLVEGLEGSHSRGPELYRSGYLGTDLGALRENTM